MEPVRATHSIQHLKQKKKLSSLCLSSHSSSLSSLSSGGGSSGVSGRWFSSSSAGEIGVFGDFVNEGDLTGEPKNEGMDLSTGLFMIGLLPGLIGDICNSGLHRRNRRKRKMV
jgi:hypothetical protein